jgi:hypothetical protein
MTTDGGSLPQFDKANMFSMGMGGPSVPLMSLPLLMQFTRNVGGKSGMGRRLSANLFSKVSIIIMLRHNASKHLQQGQ